MKNFLRTLLLLAGVALFIWFVQRAGPAEIWRTCAKLGWLAPLALVPYGVVYAVDTLGWLAAFGRRRPGLGFWTFYRIRWCGEAVNNVVPSVYVGGEAVKVYLLRQRGVPTADAASSVLISRTVQTLTQVLFIALGAAAFLRVAHLEAGSGFRLALFVVLGGSIAAVVILFWLQSRGMFSLLLALLGKLGVRLQRLEADREKLLRIDRQVSEFYRRDRKHFLLSTCAYLGGWLLDTMDIFLVAWLLGVPVSWTHALAIEAFIGVAKIVGLFVPGAIGVQESGIALICRLAGLPESFGPAYAIIRRGRELVYASLGWLFLYLGEASLKGLTTRVTVASID